MIDCLSDFDIGTRWRFLNDLEQTGNMYSTVDFVNDNRIKTSPAHGRAHPELPAVHKGGSGLLHIVLQKDGLPLTEGSSSASRPLTPNLSECKLIHNDTK